MPTSSNRLVGKVTNWAAGVLWGAWGLALALATRGLFSSAIHDTHDTTPYLWARAMFEMWQKGWWWPQWLPQIWFGFGAPVFHYYAPLYYWWVSLVQLIGLDAIVATKVVLIASLFLGAWGMYRLARHWFGLEASLLASGLFIWAPYYLALLYTRAAFPEFFALNLVPWILWALVAYYRKPTRWIWTVLVLGLVGVILSHTLTSLTVVAIAIAMLIYLYYCETKNRRAVFWVGLAGLVSLGLTAFYWLPALADAKLINAVYLTVGQFDYRHFFPSLSNLINLYRDREQAWLSTGVLHAIVWLAGLLVYFTVRKQSSSRPLGMLLLVSGILIFVATPVSLWLWKGIPWLAYYQFPTRFLGPLAIFIGLIGGWLIQQTLAGGKAKANLAGVILLLVIMANLPVSATLTSWLEHNTTADGLTMNKYIAMRLVASHMGAVEGKGLFIVDSGIMPSEYLPSEYVANPKTYVANDSEPLITNAIDNAELRLVDEKTLNPLPLLEVLNGQAVIDILEDKPWQNEAEIDAVTNATLKINRMRFPLWKITLDDEPATTYLKTGELGQFISIPAGQHKLAMNWHPSRLMTATRWLSGLFLLITLGLLLYSQPKRRLAKSGKLKTSIAKLTTNGKKGKKRESR